MFTKAPNYYPLPGELGRSAAEGLNFFKRDDLEAQQEPSGEMFDSVSQVLTSERRQDRKEQGIKAQIEHNRPFDWQEYHSMYAVSRAVHISGIAIHGRYRR